MSAVRGVSHYDCAKYRISVLVVCSALQYAALRSWIGSGDTNISFCCDISADICLQAGAVEMGYLPDPHIWACTTVHSAFGGGARYLARVCIHQEIAHDLH